MHRGLQCILVRLEALGPVHKPNSSKPTGRMQGTCLWSSRRMPKSKFLLKPNSKRASVRGFEGVFRPKEGADPSVPVFGLPVVVPEGSSGGYGFASPEILPNAVTVPATVSRGFGFGGSSPARPEDVGGPILPPPLLDFWV